MTDDVHDESYYYADGERIPLRRAERFVAVRTSGAALAARSERATEELTHAAGIRRAHVLPEFDLVVVEEAPEAAGAPAAAAAFEAAGSIGDVDAGPPVLEMVGDEQTKLIPTGEILLTVADAVTDGDLDEVLDRHAVRVVDDRSDIHGELLVTTDDPATTVAVANALHDEPQITDAEPNFVQLVPELARTTMTPRAPADATDLLDGPAAPDPHRGVQWGLDRIRAPEAWAVTRGTDGIHVAVLDEGCDTAHEDVRYRLPGYDSYADDTDPNPDGDDAHGTACAGIVTMTADNGRGGAGVAPGCRTIPIRIARGVGGGRWSTSAAIVSRAIRWAVDHGADVLSNSYSLARSSSVTNAFRYAQRQGRGGKGAVIAAASGNDDRRGVIYPARLSPSIPGFLAVGASDEDDGRKNPASPDGEDWWGSNWGPELDVVAPGVKIFTSDITGPRGYTRRDYTQRFNGTSSATPHVAGVAALLLSHDPELRSWEVADILKLTAQDLGAGGRDEETGHGRVDAARALQAARRVAATVEATEEFIGSGGECFVRLDVRVHNPGINRVRIDSVTLTSHTEDRSAVVDRFEYRGSPGAVLEPRSSDDLRFDHVLLRANGTRAAWSYRWSINWTYTFWRPSAPDAPLGAGTGDAGGVAAASTQPVRGGDQGTVTDTTGLASGADGDVATAAGGPQRIRIDTGSRTVTIVVTS